MYWQYPHIPKDFKFGVAIRKINPNQNHTGLVYINSNGNLKICHLCWHKDLRDEPFNDNRYFVSEVLLDNVNLDYLASVTELVSNSNSATSIHYGFVPPTPVFNQSGQYVGNGKGEGLTCSTFALSIFEHNHYVLLNKATWQVRAGDAVWQANIIRDLIKSCALTDRVHIAKIQQMVGIVVRYTPQELFASSLVETSFWPLDFVSADTIADSIMQIIP